MSDAMTLLDREWEMYCSSPRSTAALRRWRAAGAIPSVDDVTSLVRAMQDAHDPDARDALVYRMLVLGKSDHDARLVVLAALRPGLNKVAQTYCHCWGWEETASMTFAAALERIVTYPLTRRRRPAANIVLDVQNSLHRVRARELTAERKLGVRVSEDQIVGLSTQPNTSSAAELTEYVNEAVTARVLSREDAELILSTRVRDMPTAVVAAERGLRPGTVRAHRRASERRLAQLATLADDIADAVA